MPRPLPAPTRLVGRSKELSELARAIASGGLATLAGPPGVGKTRLCLELCDRQLVESVDVVLCDLVEASSALELCAAAARALDVDLARTDDERQAALAIADVLRARDSVLLVLDNFEHLADEATWVVEAWSAAARALLVTSRHRLGIAGESCISLEPFRASSKSPEASDGVRLFLDRFALEHASYEPTQADLAAVVRAVEDLDGLPLAIELCAARAKPPLSENLAAELEAAKTSLAEAIDASWLLLTHEEKEALSHASVFRGGLDPEGLAAIVGGIDGDRAAALLDRLVAKSLVVRTEGGRFSLLPSIRELAAGRLAETQGEGAAFDRHAAHFTSLAESLSQRDAGPEAARARRVLATEADNFLLAHRRAFASTRDPRTAVETALALAGGARGGVPIARALSYVDAALRVAQAGLDPRLEVRALLERCRLLEQMGRPAEALGSVKLAVDIAAAGADPELDARSSEARGRALLALGSWREARAALEHAAAGYEKIGLRAHAARAEIAAGDTWFYVDDLDHAAEVYGRARETAAAAGDHAVLGTATTRLAIVEMELGHADAALARYHAAIELQRSVGDRAAEAHASTYLAILEHDLGMLDVARSRLETVSVVTRELGSKKALGIASLYLGAVLLELGELAESDAALDVAERYLGEVAAVSVQAYARGWRSAVYAKSGDVEGAAQMLDLGRGHFRARKEQSFYASAVELLAGHLDLARAAASSGDQLAAAAHLASARRRLTLPLPENRAQSDVRIARRLLEAALGVAPEARAIDQPMAPAEQGPLIIEQSGGWFRAPGGAPVDLSRRAPLKKLLGILLAARLKDAGKPVPTTDLMHAVWSDTRELSVLQNRLRVAIATLRKLGLAPSLFTKSGGYILDPRREVLAADFNRHELATASPNATCASAPRS